MSETKVVLPKELTDALRKQVPEHVSAMLREQLENGERAAKALVVADEKVRNLTEDIKKVEKLNDEHGDLERKRAEIAEREDVLAANEAGFREAVLQARLEASEKYAGRLEGTLAGLVRNTEWRNSVLDWQMDGFTDMNGNYQCKSTPKDTTSEAE